MKTIKALFIGAAIAGLTCVAQAVMITGGVSLAGGTTPIGGSVTTATSYSFSGVFVTNGSGDYLGTGGTAVTQNNLVLPLPGGGITPLWFFTATPTTSFDLLSISSDESTTPNSRTITGMGLLKMDGKEDTPGTWIFTANEAAGTFSFSSSNGAVPEGGATALLLGLALVSVGAIRRFMVRA